MAVPDFFEIALQTRTGVVATSLVDGKRINASVRNQVSLLSEINIYGLDKEVPLHDILKRIFEKEEGKTCAVKPKAPADFKKSGTATNGDDLIELHVYLFLDCKGNFIL